MIINLSSAVETALEAIERIEEYIFGKSEAIVEAAIAWTLRVEQ